MNNASLTKQQSSHTTQFNRKDNYMKIAKLHVFSLVENYWGFFDVSVGYTRSLFTTQTTVREKRRQKLLATGSKANN